VTILNTGSGVDGDNIVVSDANINTDIIKDGRSYADGVFYRILSVDSYIELYF